MSDGVILYIGGFELPDKNAAAHRVLSNAKILRQLGKKVVFIGVDQSLDFEYDILKTRSEVQGFESYAVPYPKKNINWIKYLTNIKNYIEICNTMRNVEMIILYNFQAIAMHRLMNYCKRNSIKCCADITEWRSAKGESLGYRILKDSDTWYRMHFLNKRMDSLIVISSYLERYYSKCKNVVNIPVLVDCMEKKWKNTYDKSTDKLRLVYAGNPGRKDRLDKLIEALDGINRKYCLDIIGITAEQYLNYYPNHKALIDNENICFHGRLSHLDALDFVKKANYSCFLREDDRVSKAGFPTKFVEAISSGTPVLTNKTSNLTDFISEGMNAILLDSFSKKEMKAIIANIPYTIDVEKEKFDYRNYVDKMKKFLMQ